MRNAYFFLAGNSNQGVHVKKKLLLSAVPVILLALGLAFVTCDTGSSSGGSKFDGTTLAGTKWVADKTQDAETQAKLGLKKVRITMTFTSDTAGTFKAEAAEWASGATQEQKSKANGVMALVNGPFTSTYNNVTKTGTIILNDDSEETFIVDVDRKELTSTDEDGDVTVFKKK